MTIFKSMEKEVLALEKNLNSYLKASLTHASFDEMSSWVNA